MMSPAENADPISGLRDTGALTTWLYRIATTVALDHLRAQRRRPTDVTDSLDPESDLAENLAADDPRLDHLMDQQEMSECVNSYVDALSDDYRAVIVLHDLHGLSNPEIAGLLDSPLSTVKIRVHRARLQLHQAILD
ncbi:MAG: sigma-70 family RNA polymerase sigma factor, partial [bacterium]|nr:sigma-70 family RNA polymerase sigma factor [bacterium]